MDLTKAFECILQVYLLLNDYSVQQYLIPCLLVGVLLLNACLTVEAHKANSHKDKGWEKFTDAVINWINTNLDGVVFLLWGAYAQKKGAYVNKVCGVDYYLIW